MRVLVVGGGAREHAICRTLRRSPHLTHLWCAPGNPGIARDAECVPIAAEDVGRLVDFAAAERADLTVVGPEMPLTLGLADALAARGLAVFGPSRAAAEIEGSKVFAKQFMERHGIPTAPFTVVRNAAAARDAGRRFGWPVVLKADGLAAGKGVLIAGDEAELDEAVRALFEERRFGASADQVVVEGFLDGEEVSFMVLSDGERLLPLATAKDYKRIGDGDTGPNTGGMGCHSPSGLVTDEAAARLVATVLQPAVAGLAAEGRRFVGILYAGLMLTQTGPRVLEFNARLGDPETQVLLPRLEDDLLLVLAGGAAGHFGTHFDGERLRFRPEAAACVVLASPGYPGTPKTGEPIRGLDRAEALPGVEVFHAGTARRGHVEDGKDGEDAEDGELVSAGGRVLSVCALGADLAGALDRVYAAVDEIDWPGKVFRRDIGGRILARPWQGGT